MALHFSTNPAALGIVTQPDHTANPVPLTTFDFPCHALEFQGIKSADGTVNAGNVYIGTAAMNTTTGVGVIKTLAPAEQWNFDGGPKGNIFNTSKLYLQADNDNDGVQARAVEA